MKKQGVNCDKWRVIVEHYGVLCECADPMELLKHLPVSSHRREGVLVLAAKERVEATYKSSGRFDAMLVLLSSMMNPNLRYDALVNALYLTGCHSIVNSIDPGYIPNKEMSSGLNDLNK